MADQRTTSDPHELLEPFERLMDELIRGDLKRACFRPWEIAILVDIASWNVGKSVLREYRIAALHHLRNGADEPMSLSEYLAKREGKKRRAR